MDLENGITKMSQTAYIESMMKRCNVTTTAFTRAATGDDLGLIRDDEPAVDKLVREAIGCLVWVNLTRPDIALPLNTLQKVVHSPTKRMWNAIMRLMAYLNGMTDFGITYVRESGLDLEVFVDASCADDEVDRRSTTRLAVTIGSTVVCAATKTQPVTAQSTSEAEYIAAGEGVKEALFVRGVLSFIAPETSGAKIRVREDNKGVLALIEHPFSSARSKHIDVRFHFIRELFKSGKITLRGGYMLHTSHDKNTDTRRCIGKSNTHCTQQTLCVDTKFRTSSAPFPLLVTMLRSSAAAAASLAPI